MRNCWKKFQSLKELRDSYAEYIETGLYRSTFRKQIDDEVQPGESKE